MKNVLTTNFLLAQTEFHKFKDTLFNKKVLRHKMTRIQGKIHKMRKYKINKISLSTMGFITLFIFIKT